MGLILDPASLSPDPLAGRAAFPGADGWNRFVLHPAAIGGGDADAPWLPRDRWTPWAGCDLCAGPSRHRDLIVDFGTEVEAAIVLHIETAAAMNVYLTCGESEAEARGWGGYGQGAWQQVRHWRIAAAGRHQHQFEARGLRFVRVQCHDLLQPARLHACTARCQAVGGRQRGDLRIPADPLLQRLWQTSLYTARLCTRPDDVWDGPKRDRHGWYGDARICQLAFQSGYLLPGPALAMLERLPTDAWVNGIPNFSCDAVLMLHDLVLRHGTGLPGLAGLVARAEALLRWIADSQCLPDGRIRRTDAPLFFDHGFIDWSAMPVGGDLHEQVCIQAKYLESLRAMVAVQSWLGNDASAHRTQAERVHATIARAFACPGGFHHTLRRIRTGYEKYGPGWNTAGAAGASGPSRHASAWTTLAGLVPPERCNEVLESGFEATGQPPLITPMFAWYEEEARARLGDPAGAILRLRDRLAAQVMPWDSACIWESHEPECADISALGLHAWPKSLCHGWGAGLVPLVERWLLGVEPTATGWSAVRVHPPALPLAFTATIPTPLGDLHLDRPQAHGPVAVMPPAAMRVERIG
jgi:hypothetical protein